MRRPRSAAEIRRNLAPDGRYRPDQAEQAARRRACKPRKRRIAVDGVLAEVVQRLVAKRWTPTYSSATAASASTTNQARAIRDGLRNLRRSSS